MPYENYDTHKIITLDFLYDEVNGFNEGYYWVTELDFIGPFDNIVDCRKSVEEVLGVSLVGKLDLG